MNHERVNISTLPISCGILGLDRISLETDDVLYAIASRLYHPSRGAPAAQAIWSDLNEIHSAGEHLAGRILDGGHGFVLRASPVENPKTGNVIVTYIWEFNHERFKQWYVAERVKRLKKAGT
jgi:hypothetical protein